MEIDALRIALLAASAAGYMLPHRTHGELEHWLNRELTTDEIEAALVELAAHGLIEVYARAGGRGWRRIDGRSRADFEEVAFLTTAAGEAIVSARWVEFFPE